MDLGRWVAPLTFFLGGVLVAFLVGRWLAKSRPGEKVGTVPVHESVTPTPAINPGISPPLYRRDVTSIPDDAAVEIKPLDPMQYPGETLASVETDNDEKPESAVSVLTRSAPQETAAIPLPTVASSPPLNRPINRSSRTPDLVQESEQDGNLSKRWRVQVGIFAHEENADGLLKLLNEKGYEPFLEKDAIGGVSLVRVMVGAFDNETSARKLAKELKEQGYEAYLRLP